ALATTVFICLTYDIRLDVSILRVELLSPFTSGITEAVARLLLIGGSLLAAWWLARNVKPADGHTRQTRGTRVGDLVCDVIDNRLGLAPTLCYIGMSGGHLATLPLLVLVTRNASPIAAHSCLLPPTLFWAWVFLRLLQSS